MMSPQSSPPANSSLYLGLLSVLAIAAAFVVATADIGAGAKVGGALLLAGAVFAAHMRSAAIADSAAPVPESDADVKTALEFLEDDTDKLDVLDDAGSFFGGILKPAEMFRLVSSRVNEIMAFDASILLVRDDDAEKWTAMFAEGRRADIVRNIELDLDEGLASFAAATCSVEIDPKLHIETGALPQDFLKGLSMAAALPLIKDGRVFATFQIYRTAGIENPSELKPLLESVADRLAPLFAGSLAFERSLTNALTDPLTNLPNERALFMVLETQLAESQRYRDERPLTVLAIDVKNFADVNQAHGHSIGDRALGFVADTIKTQLRKMDFLARSVNDEFVVVLPGAAESVALEVIGRIRHGLSGGSFRVSENESLNIWLNIGSATFWQDGETAQELLQNARQRKQQAKSEAPGKVVSFPREYLN